jgi:hypothetical protein
MELWQLAGKTREGLHESRLGMCQAVLAGASVFAAEMSKIVTK